MIRHAIVLGVALWSAGCGSSSTTPAVAHGPVRVPTAIDEPWVFPDDPDEFEPAKVVVAEVDDPDEADHPDDPDVAPFDEAGPVFDPDFGPALTAMALQPNRDACSSLLPWPGPVTGGPDVVGVSIHGTVEAASWICDLGDRVVAVAAAEVEDATTADGLVVTGAAWSIPRPRGRAVRVELDPASAGCTGMTRCDYRTARRALGSIHEAADRYVLTAGRVAARDGDAGETCLETPSETRALCVTARHTIAIWPSACQAPTEDDDVMLELGIYDAGGSHRMGDDGRVPDRRLYGTLAIAAGDEWSYGFTDADGGAATLIVHAGPTPSASVNIDGTDEDCLAFAIDGR